jgi:DNA ligase 1
VQASDSVARTASRLAKRDAIAACLRTVAFDEVEIAVALLSGEIRTGRVGVGYASLKDLRGSAAADQGSLTLHDVDSALVRIAATTGKGSAAARAEQLAQLFARATSTEQDFLVRLLVGELRQGALEGVMIEAVAAAAAVPEPDVRRAAMFAGDLGAVAHVALNEGARGLARFTIQIQRPVQPMLAQSAEDVAEALERLGTVAFEWKLDGARVQVHKAGGVVRVFSRLLNEVTGAVPEIVEAIQALPAHELILDGEAIAIAPSGAPRPFQITMRRFGRKLDVDALRGELPLTAYYFDCL